MRYTGVAAIIGFGLTLLACNAPGAGQPSALVGGGGTVADTSGNWPHYRGPNSDGVVKADGINVSWQTKAPKLVWQKPLGDQGYTGPAAANGLLYVIDHNGNQDIVRALKLSDGSEAWNYPYPDADSPNYGFARSTPTIDGDKVYIVSRLGKVICLTAKDGQKVWQVDMASDFQGQHGGWDYACSPVIDGQRLIVTPGANDAAIVALDKTTGKVLMKGGSGVAAYSTPVVATIGGKKQYVVFLAKKVCGIDATNGQELWSAPWETAYDVNASQPLVIGDSVFVSSGYGKGCAMFDIKGNQAVTRWQNKAIQEHFSSAVVLDGKIYGTSDPGVLVCLDPASGNTLWKQQGFEKGGLIAVNNVLLAHNGSNGDLIMVKIDPSSYQELGRIAPLKGQAWTAPILVGKTLIVRNTTAIAAVDLS